MCRKLSSDSISGETVKERRQYVDAVTPRIGDLRREAKHITQRQANGAIPGHS